MSKREEDIYSPESEKKRLLSTVRNRIDLWNLAERMMTKRHIPYSIESIGINTNNIEDMKKFIIKNNNRIDEIRDHLKVHGTPIQKQKLSGQLSK